MKEKKLKLLIIIIAFAAVGLMCIQFYWIYSIIKLEKDRIYKNVTEALNNAVADIDKFETEKQIIKIFANKSTKGNFVFEKQTITNSKINKAESTFKVNGNKNHKVDIKIDSKMKSLNNNGSVIVFNGDTVVNLSSKLNNLDSIINKKKKIIDKVFDDVFVFNFNIKFEDRIPFKVADSLINANLLKKGIYHEYCFGIINKNKDSIVYKTKNCNKYELINAKFKLPVLSNPFEKNSNYLHLFIKDDLFYFAKKIGIMLLLSVLFLSLIIFVFYKTLKSYFLQKKISELKTDLINNVSHEFKTPIASIGLAGEMIKSFNVLEQNKYIGIIEQENNRLKDMVESLLNGAKLEHGELKTDLTKVELIYEINKIIEKYKIVTDKNTGSIKLKSNNEKIFFNTDRFCFNNIINNIIDNAVKYCSVSPNVFINVIEFESNIKIMIEDNGYGIEKKYMKEIFEPFFRVPTGNIYKGKGYGLGLSYVKKSVEALKGEIFVESVINKGTTFTIILPKL